MSAQSTGGEAVSVGGPLSSPPQMVLRWDGRGGSCILIPPRRHVAPPPSPTSELGKV